MTRFPLSFLIAVPLAALASDGFALPAPHPPRPMPALRVQSANAGSTIEPSSEGYLGAVQVYPFAEGSIYQLYAAPGQVTDIALQPGEGITSVAAGDTVRWTVGDTTS